MSPRSISWPKRGRSRIVLSVCPRLTGGLVQKRALMRGLILVEEDPASSLTGPSERKSNRHRKAGGVAHTKYRLEDGPWFRPWLRGRGRMTLPSHSRHLSGNKFPSACWALGPRERRFREEDQGLRRLGRNFGRRFVSRGSFNIWL